MELGERIAVWRVARGKTLRAVGKALDINHTAVAQWEAGSTAPTQKNLARLVKLFRLTMEEFYGPVPSPKKVKAA